MNEKITDEGEIAPELHFNDIKSLAQDELVKILPEIRDRTFSNTAFDGYVLALCRQYDKETVDVTDGSKLTNSPLFNTYLSLREQRSPEYAARVDACKTYSSDFYRADSFTVLKSAANIYPNVYDRNILNRLEESYGDKGYWFDVRYKAQSEVENPSKSENRMKYYDYLSALQVADVVRDLAIENLEKRLNANIGNKVSTNDPDVFLNKILEETEMYRRISDGFSGKLIETEKKLFAEAGPEKALEIGQLWRTVYFLRSARTKKTTERINQKSRHHQKDNNVELSGEDKAFVFEGRIALLDQLIAKDYDGVKSRLSELAVLYPGIMPPFAINRLGLNSQILETKAHIEKDRIAKEIAKQQAAEIEAENKRIKQEEIYKKAEYITNFVKKIKEKLGENMTVTERGKLQNARIELVFTNNKILKLGKILPPNDKTQNMVTAGWSDQGSAAIMRVEDVYELIQKYKEEQAEKAKKENPQ